MSEPIKEGDLAVVVRTCCPENNAKYLGRISKIAQVHHSATQCMFCGHREVGLHARDEVNVQRGRTGAPLWWLKRIPPFPELQDERHEEEITA